MKIRWIIKWIIIVWIVMMCIDSCEGKVNEGRLESEKIGEFEIVKETVKGWIKKYEGKW